MFSAERTSRTVRWSSSMWCRRADARCPEFSRRPVLPGRSVEIRVTYDPMNRPGAFDKELTVFDEEKRPAARLGVWGR